MKKQVVKGKTTQQVVKAKTTRPFENRDHLAGICWTASALPDDFSVHRRSMDYAITVSPQLGRDHRRGSNHGRKRGKVGGHLFLPPQTATNGAPNPGRRCCSCPRALIHSRLDYCNSVLAGLPAYMFKRLQSVLNAAARLVLQLPGRQSVSIPMALKLHWLGFPHRVTYKLCVLV